VILEIDLDRGVLQSLPENPLQAVRAINSPTMGLLAGTLRKAALDDRVKGLVMHIGSCPLTPAQIDELGRSVAAFGEHKPTVAYAETFGELSSGMFAYRLATSAREIWLQPSGAVVLGGVHLEIALLRGGLEKLGIDPDFEQRYEYKTAGDQLAATEVTPANREMMQRIADSLVDETVRIVADRRGLTGDEVRAVVDGGQLSAAEAKARRLVDHVGYRDEVYAAVRAQWGADATLQYASRYAGTLAVRVAEQLTRRHLPTVAVVTVHGGIVTGRGGQTAAGRQAGARRSPSTCARRWPTTTWWPWCSTRFPGGSYVASDTIRGAVLQLRQHGRPVVAPMGAVAARWLLAWMGADEVVALESTLTGSIGVVAGKLVNQRLFDKLGIVREGISAGANADLNAGGHRWSDEQRAQVERWLDEVYDDFTQKAAADRHLPLARVRELARGRVWTGADAHERGLSTTRWPGAGCAARRRPGRLARDRVQVRLLPALGLLERLYRLSPRRRRAPDGSLVRWSERHPRDCRRRRGRRRHLPRGAVGALPPDDPLRPRAATPMS
jgi:protease-4